MEDYQKRMLDEFKELADRTDKLETFINSDKFKGLDENKRILMMVQLNAMAQYGTVLGARCKLEGISVDEIMNV